MNGNEQVVTRTSTGFGRYEVVDKVYDGRPARVLYSQNPLTAQSAIPLDGNDEMVFSYNQRLVELFKQSSLANVLIIGGGVYTLAQEFIRLSDKVKVDVVEPNQDLDSLAKKHFQFKDSSRQVIYHDFGAEYLKASSKKYDLIVIDAYMTDRIPPDMLTLGFVRLLNKALSNHGIVAANIISTQEVLSPINLAKNVYLAVFKNLKVFPSDTETPTRYRSENYIVMASKQADLSGLKLKYPAVTL